MHLNFRSGSTFPVPVCTVPSSKDRTCRSNKVDAVTLYASYRLNLLLLKGQICVTLNTYINYAFKALCDPSTISIVNIFSLNTSNFVGGKFYKF